jgi:hypothetical protein
MRIKRQASRGQMRYIEYSKIDDGAKMDENLYALMVNLTAQMEIMRNAMLQLASNHIRALPLSMKESALLELQDAMSEMPFPKRPSAEAEDTFHKNVRSVVPGHAQFFVQELRRELSKTN